jgi:hypothetical protein
MRTAITMMLAFTVLAGCGLIADLRPKPPPAARALASRACAAVAQSRMQDAAANGYETDMQRAVFDESYASCVKNEAGRLVPQDPGISR